jgi:hypothetical protein
MKDPEVCRIAGWLRVRSGLMAGLAVALLALALNAAARAATIAVNTLDDPTGPGDDWIVVPTTSRKGKSIMPRLRWFLAIVTPLCLAVLSGPGTAFAVSVFGCAWSPGDPPCLWANAETGLGTGQNYGVLIGDQILADGIGFTPGEPLDLYWDDVYINTYTPGTDGSFSTFVSDSDWGYTVEDFGNVDGLLVQRARNSGRQRT